MADTYTNFVASGGNDIFTFGINYINKEDIYIYLDGVETTEFTWINDNTIKLNSIPQAGTLVKVERNTELNERLVDFQDGSMLTEQDLDLDSMQALYLIQETYDRASSSLLPMFNGDFDAKGHRIINLANPINNQDAVTLKYFNDHKGQDQGSGGGSEQDLTQIRNDIINLYETKQDDLISGINIKTVNNQSIVGSGNIAIQAVSPTPFDKDWVLLTSNGSDYNQIGLKMERFPTSNGTVTHVATTGNHYDATNHVKNFNRVKLATTGIDQFISINSENSLAIIDGINDYLPQDHYFYSRFGFDTLIDNNYKLFLGEGGIQLSDSFSEPDFDCIGLIKKSTSNNLMFCLSDGGGSYKYYVDTGHVAVQGCIYEFTFKVSKKSYDVYFKLVNRDTGFVFERTLTGKITNHLNFRTSLQSYGTSKTTELSILKVYVENSLDLG